MHRFLKKATAARFKQNSGWRKYKNLRIRFASKFDDKLIATVKKSKNYLLVARPKIVAYSVKNPAEGGHLRCRITEASIGQLLRYNRTKIGRF